MQVPALAIFKKYQKSINSLRVDAIRLHVWLLGDGIRRKTPYTEL
jgi:hypothetical protein